MSKKEEIKLYTIESSKETNSGVSLVLKSSTDSSKEKSISLNVDKTIVSELLETLEPGTHVRISENSEVFIIIEGTSNRLADLIVTFEMEHGIDPDQTLVDNGNSLY